MSPHSRRMPSHRYLNDQIPQIETNGDMLIEQEVSPEKTEESIYAQATNESGFTVQQKMV